MTEIVAATSGVGRRFGRTWALRDCTLELPKGAIVGLIGPNGAGKTTLLHLLVGLLAPTTGSLTVLGRPPGGADTRSRIGFVAQDKPLYKNLSVTETVHMGGWLNPHFDQPSTLARLDRLEIDPRQRVGKLSGGQHAQVALALALGKQPDLLVLDEPVANLDPVARRDFLRMVMADVADTGRSVLFSSHVLADLQNTCDYLVLLSAAHVQLTGDVDTLTHQHLMLSGPRDRVAALRAAHSVIHIDESGRHASLLVRAHGPINDPTFTSRPATLEELALAYMTSHVTPPVPPRLVAFPPEVSE